MLISSYNFPSVIKTVCPSAATVAPSVTFLNPPVKISAHRCSKALTLLTLRCVHASLRARVRVGLKPSRQKCVKPQTQIGSAERSRVHRGMALDCCCQLFTLIAKQIEVNEPPGGVTQWSGGQIVSLPADLHFLCTISVIVLTVYGMCAAHSETRYMRRQCGFSGRTELQGTNPTVHARLASYSLFYRCLPAPFGSSYKSAWPVDAAAG